MSGLDGFGGRGIFPQEGEEVFGDAHVVSVGHLDEEVFVGCGDADGEGAVCAGGFAWGASCACFHAPEFTVIRWVVGEVRRWRSPILLGLVRMF